MAMELLEKGHSLIVRLDGKLDSFNAKDVDAQIASRLKSVTGDIIFDLENLDYISSAGLQVLISCAKDRKALGRKVLIYKPNEMVDNIIRVTGFYSFLDKAEHLSNGND